MRLHILTDTHIQSRWSHSELATMAAAAGADVIQYREKHKPQSAQIAEVREIMASLPASSTAQLVVNDHIDVALHGGARGVHLGQEDGALHEALSRLPAGSVVGATVHFLHELEAIAHLPLSYIGVGPVFGTRSKNTPLPPLGVAGLGDICKAAPFPVIAIGGITAANIPEVMACGAYGVAVLGAFCCAADPAHALKQMRTVLYASIKD